MIPRQTPAHVARRRKDRLVKWVGLLALAGLLAIATLPTHRGQHASADGSMLQQSGSGDSPWHG